MYGGRGGGGGGRVGSELYGPLFARCGLENVFISTIRVRLDGKRQIVLYIMSNTAPSTGV